MNRFGPARRPGAPRAVLLGLTCAAVLAGTAPPALPGPPAPQERDTARSSQNAELRACVERAMAKADRGQLDEAEAGLEGCLEIRDDVPMVHLGLGQVLLEKLVGRNEPLGRAIRHLERALELGPGLDLARYLLAKTYALRNPPGTYDAEKAAGHYRKLIERQPDRLPFRIEYARWLADQEVRLRRQATPGRVSMHSAWSLEEARSQMEEVLRRAPPGSPEAHLAEGYIAEIVMKLGEFRLAERMLEEVLAHQELSPDSRARALQKLGHSRVGRGDFTEAARAFKQAYALAPTSLHQWDLHLVSAYMGVDTGAAAGMFRSGIRPDSPEGSGPPRLRFTDAAERLGVDKLAGAGPSAWGDVDGDGREDLLVCGLDVYCSLYRNEGERFREITAEAGLSRLESGFGAVFADYDNDGDMDFYVARNGWSGPSSNSLMQNDGKGVFTDVTRRASVDAPGSSFNAAWADFNRDGWLDLIVTQGVTADGSVNRLFLGSPGGTFRDVTAESGIEEPPGFGTIGVAVGDSDGDGWLDIFVHGRYRPNRLYRNQGDGTFEDVAPEAGVAGSGKQNGYVAFFSDMDADGDLDIFAASLAGWETVIEGFRPGYEKRKDLDMVDTPHFWRNEGNGKFTDRTEAAGLVFPIGVMSGGIADLDNDGYPEVLLGTGDPQFHRLEPNILLANVGGERFVDVTSTTPTGSLEKGHGVSFTDWDRDGDLDVYFELGGFYPGDYARSAFYLNETASGNNWLSVMLEQPKLNRFAVGAGVTVVTEGASPYQEVQAGEGFGSTSPPVLHFGLGDRSTVRELRVRWPDGTRQTYKSPPVNRRLRIRKGAASWTEEAAGETGAGGSGG